MEQWEEEGDLSPVSAATPRRSRGRGLLWLLVLPAIGALSGWLVAALWTYVTPKQYESTAVVQVHPPVQEVDPFGGAMGEAVTGAYATRQFFATEFAVITAEQTLQRVVDRLDLTSRWNQSPSAITDTLQKIVSTEQIRGTDLIEIKVRYTKAQDARDIAEKVAEAYKERRTTLEMDRAHKALNALDQELRNQEDLVEEKRKVLDTIVQATGIPYVEDDAGGGAAGHGGREIYKLAERNLYELEQERQKIAAQVDAMRRLKDEELRRYAAALDIRDNDVRDLGRELRTEQKVLEGLRRAGLGDQNPDVVRQRARIEVLQEDLDQGIGTIHAVLETQLELVTSRIGKMERVVAEKRNAAVDQSLKRRDFTEAKREYEQGQEMLQSMKLQHASKRIALQIPKNPITIHEAPKIARKSRIPNVDRNLFVGSAAGFVLGLLLAIPIALVAGLRK